MPSVTLVALSDEQAAAFIDEQVADYAAQQVRDAGWLPDEALERARQELGPELEQALARAGSIGHRLWTALDASGEAVGWLWVTPPLPDMPPTSAFLEQITVRETRRRQGYGRLMLAALEHLLATEAVTALYLHVFDANQPALRLYEAMGYQVVVRYPAKRRLSKALGSA